MAVKDSSDAKTIDRFICVDNTGCAVFNRFSQKVLNSCWKNWHFYRLSDFYCGVELFFHLVAKLVSCPLINI